MQLSQENRSYTLTTRLYTLTCATDRPYMYLDDADGNRLADLFVMSSVNPAHGRDDTVRNSSWQAEERPDEVVLSIQADSSYWKSKSYRFRCWEDGFQYEIEVEGQGDLYEVNYFGGYYSALPRWGSGFFWSGHRFEKGFNPEPTTDENYYFLPGGGSAIDISGVPLPGKAGWFFTPPPYCFGLKTPTGWMSMGIEAEAGQNRYTDYWYRGQQSGFCLLLSYEGHTSVKGRYLLPAVSVDFGQDEYDVLRQHVQTLQRRGYVQSAPARQKPEWWYEPIFSGWGAQCYLSAARGEPAPKYAQQSLYEGFIQTLTGHNIAPGIIVIDDKWQACYGTNEADPDKWPDMKGFVKAQHDAGRKVLLWLKAWDPEGVPLSECIVNAGGLPLAFDPTNPAFERRLREQVQRMLCPDGYDADGFKIDFTARIPTGPHIHTYGDVWGLELMKLYLKIIYEEAKRAKPDALIMAHTPHPYLADVVDMIRLNDINTGKDVNNAMQHRARVARIACPNAIIDTDNWPITNRDAWRKYVRLQPELGVPSLYYASHIDTTQEPLDEDDYQLIRDAWARHRRRG
ncbi:MAG: hypothetical protein HZC41_25895 [Chloroflexi bacterium]|nr:hypothetical protein [Chloroflexota bacterium]